MELYKKEKVNPMGSCGFLLIQMPILLVIYNIILWIQDPVHYYHVYSMLQSFQLSDINFTTKGKLNELNEYKMSNGSLVKDNLVNLIAKIGEKITIRRTNFFDNLTGSNYFYVHSALEKNIGKIISIVKLDGVNKENEEIGTKIAMHIAASNPLAIDKDGIDKLVVDKEWNYKSWNN